MRRALPLALLLLLAPALASAQMGAVPPPPPATPSVLPQIGFDQHLGGSVPLELAFTDETGRAVKLGDYFGSKPVVLSLVYYGCPMLCTLSLNGLSAALEVLSFVPGQEFEVVTVSFDPKETPALAAAKKKVVPARYKRPGAQSGWHFLTGPAESIAASRARSASATSGTSRPGSSRTRRGSWSSRPRGTSRTTCSASSTRPNDLRLALVAAAGGRIGSAADQLLLYCYRYDPQAGRFSASILNLVRLLGVLTVLGLAAFILTASMARKAQGEPRARTTGER